ncbi:uncharacterized protein LOC133794662 [Humulus lupulus]|uniref:uncharacterized protein LOC133794662 n=1 Tax=Humulus lupulus TaxID=3486 RepID=UPI002B4152D2|nr:uncharacterized protein LOC133794662 [Humulus lupulus]
MALKFLNKKGWHTGSLRNIENVWKAEQKHDAEQKKLEELRKQIHEERERSEFRQLQEQAGLVPKQERLEFLYDSGLAVGKASASDGFKALEAFPKPDDGPSSSTSAASKQAESSSAVPGALFEDKPQSANDAWRKLHSDPLLMIRQREQEALARIKNNPVQMAMIRKSVEGKPKKKSHEEKEDRKKKRHSSSKHQRHSSSSKSEEEKTKNGHRKRSNYDKYSDSEDESHKKASHRKSSNYDKYSDSDDESRRKSSHKKSSNYDKYSDLDDSSHREASRNEKNSYRSSKYREQSPDGQSKRETVRDGQNVAERNLEKSEKERYVAKDRQESHHKRRNAAPKMSEEERAARLREMQMDAELHEEQRWKRLKKADDDDAREATQAAIIRGKNFLDEAQKSVYGTEKGGSKSIAESVRRRTHYTQGRSLEGNAFRR